MRLDDQRQSLIVEGMLAKLFPLIENTGFGSKSPSSSIHQVSEDEAPSIEIANLEELDSGNSKSKSKRKRNVAPKGHTCSDKIISLKEDGFFKDKRGTKDIIAGLSQKVFTHKANQVAAPGESLFKKNLLQRTKDGKGPFMYYWDRD
nr:hypothetical protein [Methylobacterium sp. ZNC0032]